MRGLPWVAGLWMASAVAYAACSGDGSSKGGGGGSGGATADAPVDAPSFDASTCWQCSESACGSQITTCNSEPSCAHYLECVLACPTASDGNVDASCASACAAPTDPAAKQDYDLLQACRSQAAKSCSCGASTDGGADGGNPILNQQCPTSTETGACAKCEDEHCCVVYQDCQADASCKDFFTCIKACSSDPSWAKCNEDCVQQYPDGLNKAAPRLACLSVFCFDSDACGNAPLSSCEKCINAKCPDTFASCFADPECYLASLCVDECPTGDKPCIQDCKKKHPAGATALDEVTLCSAQQCDVECAAI